MDISVQSPEAVRTRWENIGRQYLLWYLLARDKGERLPGEYGILARYRLPPCIPNATSYSTARIWWDAEFGLALQCNGEVVACVGFNLRKRSLVIAQVQGLPKRSRYPDRANFLRPFKWDRMLCEAAIAIARDLGYCRVEIRPAEKNVWYERSIRPKKRGCMTRRYDENALALGFEAIPGRNFRLERRDI